MPHAFEEHTAEVRLRASAPTAEALFEEIVVAIAELMVDDPTRPTDGEIASLRVTAHDMPALLVAFVDEIVFLSETKKKVFSRAKVERASETEVVAKLEGFSPNAIKTAVKAATFYEIACVHEGDEWRACVVLDV